jgi:hypothetical protein
MNEDEKLWKQELMKEANDAYKNNNLFKLLELEMNWLSKQGNYLNSMPIEKLQAFNNLLRKQSQELEFENYQVYQNPRFDDVTKFISSSINSTKKRIEAECKEINKTIDTISKVNIIVQQKQYPKEHHLLMLLDNCLGTNDYKDDDDFFDMW